LRSGDMTALASGGPAATCRPVHTQRRPQKNMLRWRVQAPPAARCKLQDESADVSVRSVWRSPCGAPCVRTAAPLSVGQQCARTGDGSPDAMLISTGARGGVTLHPGRAPGARPHGFNRLARSAIPIVGAAVLPASVGLLTLCFRRSALPHGGRGLVRPGPRPRLRCAPSAVTHTRRGTSAARC